MLFLRVSGDTATPAWPYCGVTAPMGRQILSADTRARPASKRHQIVQDAQAASTLNLNEAEKAESAKPLQG